MKVRIGAHRVLVGRPERKRPHGRPRYGWENNIKMDLQEVVYEGINWIYVAQVKEICRTFVSVEWICRFHKMREIF
jgi:hypothetical protein